MLRHYNDYKIPNGNWMTAEPEPVRCHREKYGDCEYNYLCDIVSACVRENYDDESIDVMNYCFANGLPIVSQSHELDDVHFANYYIGRGQL